MKLVDGEKEERFGQMMNSMFAKEYQRKHKENNLLLKK